MAFDQGAPQFGLADGKVQTWASAGTYSGSLTDIMSIQMAGFTLQQISAQLTGDDQITATDTRAIGGQLQLRFGGINLSALAIILGKVISTISSVNQQGIQGGHRMPYFGFMGRTLAAEGGGNTVLYVPKCKLIGDFQLAMLEYGNFAIPEVTVQCVPDATYGIYSLITHPTDVPLTVMPPENIAAVT
jgi:hypothetical protein